MSPGTSNAPAAVATEHGDEFVAMAGAVRVRAVSDRDARPTFAEVRRVFADVEATCTRFDPTSDLMRANARGQEWCEVAKPCWKALLASFEAYLATGGSFDPRVLSDLVAHGYDRTLAFGGPPISAPTLPGPRERRTPWTPLFDRPRWRVAVGPDPIDLGGIGKGLAVRWAAEKLRSAADSFVIDAGGDCHLAGPGPSGDGWDVGVEDPSGGPDPVAVLRVRDAGCATSSTRVRRWLAGGVRAHHLIDPTRGVPADESLLSVTVVAADTATAEVWSKALFVLGADRIAERARRERLAAVWVHPDGRIGTSAAAERSLIWIRPS